MTRTPVHIVSDVICLDRPFVLTQGHLLVVGMPYLYTQGNYIAGVRLLDISEADNVLYLELQELDSNKIFTASWDLDYKGSYYLWTLADLKTLMTSIK